MEKKNYVLPVSECCGEELEFNSFYDKIACYINEDGTVEEERQNKDGPELVCTSCDKSHEFYFDSKDRVCLY